MEFPEKYSRKILRNFLAKIRGKNLRIFFETNSQNADPLKISQIGDQFRKISQKFPRNQSQTLVLEKGIEFLQQTPIFKTLHLCNPMS